MPRLMSVAFTEQQVRDRSKTVTRRNGWKFLKPGDRLTLCRKVMGRKPGEELVRIATVEVVSVRREPLACLGKCACADLHEPGTTYPETEMVREGFPGLDPHEFVQRYFINAQGLGPDADVTRIEWRYLDPAPTAADRPDCGHPDCTCCRYHPTCVDGCGNCTDPAPSAPEEGHRP